MKIDGPTLHLLTLSSLVGFSGGLRLYLAYLLVSEVPKIPLVLAAMLIVYSTYTLDRSLENGEDRINRPQLHGADKNTGLIASGIALLIGIAIFLSEKLIFLAIFPFAVGFVYSRGIRFRRWQIKLKGGAGLKNLIIGITWGGTIGLLIVASGHTGAAMVICFYFAAKLFINSTIFDLRDVRGDIAAGIQTLPVWLGEQKVRYLLFSVCIIQHVALAAGMFTRLLGIAVVFLSFSFAASGSVIAFYRVSFESDSSWLKRRFRIIMINGEPMILSVLSIFLPY